MTNPPISTPPRTSWLWPTVIVTLWGAAIVALASQEWFRQGPPQIPSRLGLALMLPPIIFMAIWTFSKNLRAWVTSLDLGLIVLAQSWRVLGMVFLFLWALGSLPITFALPAGLGDVAVGVFAVFVGAAVLRKSPGWQQKAYLLIWLGLLDFVIAFSTAILSAKGRPLNLPGQPLPDMMQSLPMILIPAYGVPLFIILHLIAWIKLRQEAAP